MPTHRFERLCEEKRKIVSNAVMDEFKRTSYGELRISRIARNAHISRGSLYTYFCDKEDMFEFALSQTWKSVLDYNKQALLELGGDYWEMMRSSLDYHLTICRSNQICRLLFLASEHGAVSWEAMLCRKWADEYEWYKDWIYQYRKKDAACAGTREEWDETEDNCQRLLRESVQNYLHGDGNEEEIRNDFYNGLMQIKEKACMAR